MVVGFTYNKMQALAAGVKRKTAGGIGSRHLGPRVFGIEGREWVDWHAGASSGALTLFAAQGANQRRVPNGGTKQAGKNLPVKPKVAYGFAGA